MSDPTLYLYTSLTAGSSHIVTATARLETILKANKIPFRAIDVATDEAARKLWGRRSKGKKLPGLVKYGSVVGDLEQIEEWNEYGELKQQIANVEDFDSLPATDTPTSAALSSASTPKPSTPLPKPSTIKIQNPPAKESHKDDSITVALRQASEQAAAKAKENAPTQTKKADAPAVPEQENSTVDTDKKQGSGEHSVRRASVACEIAQSNSQRPPLVPEVAAESSANFHADNAETLGLIQHHRNSNIAAESKEEGERIAHEIRKSISGDHKANLDALKNEAKAKVDADETLEEALET